MKSGIYHLTYRDGATYVGQSVDIPSRMVQHADKLMKGTASKKMLEAYQKWGMPTMSVIVYCHPMYLDLMEAYYINYSRSDLNTSVPPVADIDYDWLLDNQELFLHHPLELLKEQVIQGNTHRDKVEELTGIMQGAYAKQFAKLAVKEDRRMLQEYDRQLRVRTHELAAAEEKITRLLNRSWLDRLFNHQ